MPGTQAPPAPPAAPAAPPTPPPAPPASPAKHGSAHLDSSFDLLDQIANPPAPKPPTPPKTPPKTPPAEPPAEPEGAPDPVEPGDNGEPKPPQPNQKYKAKDLRQAYDQMKAKVAELESKYEKVSKEPIDLKNHPDVVKLTERLRLAEERSEEKEKELKYSNFERSEEYKTKWLQPYLDAYTEGQSFVQQLQVEQGEDNFREGKPEDFDMAVSAYLRDPKEGLRVMNELFGDQAPGVMYHAKEVQKLLTARRRAEEDYRKTGADREKQMTEHQSNIAKQRRDMYEAAKNEGIEKYSQWSKPVEGDDDGNRLLERAREQADAAFGNRMRNPSTGEPVDLSPEQMVKLHAAIHNRATMAPRLVHWLKQRDARIAELETKVKEYEGSEPPPGENRGPAGAPTMSLWDRVEADLNKRAR